MSFRDGTTSMASLSQQLPLTCLATTSAVGVLVHSRCAFDRVQPTSAVPVMCASLPHAPGVSPPDPAAVRAKYSDAKRYRLVLFGHFGKNRCLEVVLRGLCSFRARHRFHLDVYGDLDQRDSILALVRELALEPLVRIHGFVPESTLTAALQEAHLAINLRFPTMGEASGSQLRIFDHALPSFVTPVGWYAELPSEVVNFVRPGHETADLHALLDAFLRDPTRFAAQGLAGRRILERYHGVQTYAHDLVEFASSCGRNRGRVALRDVARRAAAEIGKIAGPRGAAIGFESLTDQVLALRGQRLLPSGQADSPPASLPRIAA
jgi:glycosyltransferase involved in cell wall biosynthesis